MLAAGCASPSCHGDATRPLEVFALGRHRLAPIEVHDTLPLSTEERRRNFERACGFLVDLDVPDDSALLSEPLAPATGHAGGVVFEDETADGYVVIEGWIADALARRP